MQFDLVTPQNCLASATALAVDIAGTEGDMTVMPSHLPLVTGLRPGVLRAKLEGQVVEYAVIGGFAQIAPDSVCVLAERAAPLAELKAEMVHEAMAEVEAEYETADAARQDVLKTYMADLKNLEARIG